MRRTILAAVFVLIAMALSRPVAGQTAAKISVGVDKPGVAISPILYGLMTEEINHSYDGGLYAELIQNRIFKDDPAKPVHWSLAAGAGSGGSISLDDSNPVNTTALTTSLRLDVTAVAAGGRVGVANNGYWGIPVAPSTRYTASFYARASAAFSGPLTVGIESSDGSKIWASATIPAVGQQWQHYSVRLDTGSAPPSTDNRFVISTGAAGSVWFNLVSLFPPTFNDRPNGNRIGLMQKLADLHPAFLRFPGGNYLEGDSIADRFAWEKTVHGLEDRPGHPGPWRYRSSDGLGLLEFLQWCQDLRMQPLLAVFAGYSLKGQGVTGEKLQPFVQEALDEIEYVTGDSSTPWGRQRALDGHPQPFELNYVEIGNEDYFDRTGNYDQRFTQFYDAIKAKYPRLQLIASAPLKTRRPDLVDDHFYRSARHMERDVDHYDGRDRGEPKVLVGEWATKQGSPTPTLNSALADAAWLTGLDRNSDVVMMSCYAPLLVNVNLGASQWPTNLIGFDAQSSFGSPSYYVQKMFAENRGDQVLPVRIETPPQAAVALPPPSGKIGVGTWTSAAEFKDFRVTRADTVGPIDFKTGKGTWSIKDGALRQSDDHGEYRALAGDDGWTDYTYSFKARKLSGDNGFVAVFHYRGGEDYLRWNIGGWHNTAAAIEQIADGMTTSISPSVPTTIETGKWYDVRIELAGRNIKCYLGAKLIIEAVDALQPPLPTLFAAASRENAGGQVILKVVNTAATVQPAQILLGGAADVAKSAAVEVLTGQPSDMNTIQTPEKIVPRRQDITDAAPDFVHDFPPYSVSVMRFTVK